MSKTGARRVVTTDSARASRRGGRLLSGGRGPSRWRNWRVGLGPAVGGIIAAIQAVFITFLTITVPAVATYVATSGNPDLAETAWWDALHVGTDIWLLGHGGTTILDGALVTAVPLGISFLALLATSGTFRRTLSPTAGAWLMAVVTYPLALVLLGAIFASHAGRAGLWRAGLGALALALIGVTTGLFRHAGGPDWERLKPRWASRIPAPLITAARGGVLAISALVLAAGVVAGWWIFQGQGAIGDVLVGLGGDWLSIFVLGAAQLLLAPNLVVWALAWLSGAGFAVGEGTLWAPDAVFTGPLPALPIFGALPQPDSFLPGNWIYLVVAAIGVLSVIPTVRRHRNLAWYWSLAVAVTAAVIAALGALVLSGLASGSLGPGRMESIGPDAVKVMIHVLLPVLIGALLAAFVTGKHARAGWTYLRAWSKSRGGTKTHHGAPSRDGDQSGGVSWKKSARRDSKSDPYSKASSTDPQSGSHTAPGPKP